MSKLGIYFLLNVSIALCSRIGYYNLCRNPYWPQRGGTTMTTNPNTTEKRPLPRMRTIAKSLGRNQRSRPQHRTDAEPVTQASKVRRNPPAFMQGGTRSSTLIF